MIRYIKENKEEQYYLNLIKEISTKVNFPITIIDREYIAVQKNGKILYGIRFNVDKNIKMFRINWENNYTDVYSIDFWKTVNQQSDFEIKIKPNDDIIEIISNTLKSTNESYIRENKSEEPVLTPDEIRKQEIYAKYGIKQLSGTEKFEKLKIIIRQVAEGKKFSAIISGDPGIGKTTEVTNILEKEYGLIEDYYKTGEGYYTYMRGKVSPAGLIDLLFTHRKSIIVFDDCDMQDQNLENILKAATDDKKKRRIDWKNEVTRRNENKLRELFASKDLDYEELVSNNEWDIIVKGAKVLGIGSPTNFVFEGRMIVITNLYKEQLDEAFVSRSGFMELDLTQNEQIDRIKSVIPYLDIPYSKEDKEGALKFLESIKDSWVKIDFRKFKEVVSFYTIRNKCSFWKSAIMDFIYQNPGDIK